MRVQQIPQGANSPTGFLRNPGAAQTRRRNTNRFLRDAFLFMQVKQVKICFLQ